jgi:hypothetical protein
MDIYSVEKATENSGRRDKSERARQKLKKQKTLTHRTRRRLLWGDSTVRMCTVRCTLSWKSVGAVAVSDLSMNIVRPLHWYFYYSSTVVDSRRHRHGTTDTLVPVGSEEYTVMIGTFFSIHHSESVIRVTTIIQQQ